MRPNEKTQPSPPKQVSVILFATISKQFTIQTAVLSEGELQLPAQIPRYLRVFYHDIHRPSLASKNTTLEMSFWPRHKSVICFQKELSLKKLTAPYKNCQLLK